MSIEQLLSEIIGEGYESTLAIFKSEEIEIKAFYELDLETLREASKCNNNIMQ